MTTTRFACLGLVLALHTFDCRAGDRPNVVVIMADDLGYEGLGCYGASQIETPHLDRLAAGGVRCTDFHSNGPVCSPTRAAFMTGRYQQRSGVSGVVTALSHRGRGLALDEQTLGEAMQQCGYRTALFGKWHLGYDPGFNPIRQGFDEYRGFVSGNIDYHRHIDQEGHFDWWRQDRLEDDPGYLTDLITDYGVDFIRRTRDRPFLLVLTHGAPHTPLQVRDSPGFRVVGKLAKRQPRMKVEDPIATYHEMIELLDEGVGRVIAEIDSLGLREKTLIVFCSDNGPSLRFGSAGPYRGGKGSVYEGGHRVPGVFNWRGALPEGADCQETLLTMDLMPTFLELAGGAAERDLDGVSVLSALRGEELEPRSVFWKFKGKSAVRRGGWKLVAQRSGATLYDLSNDPAESVDVSAEHADTAKELQQQLADWEASVLPTGEVVSD